MNGQVNGYEARLVVIYVTHSLGDAIAARDRPVVMREGKIERIVALEELIRKVDNQAAAEALSRKEVGQTIVCPTSGCFDLKKTRNTRK